MPSASAYAEISVFQLLNEWHEVYSEHGKDDQILRLFCAYPLIKLRIVFKCIKLIYKDILWLG